MIKGVGKQIVLLNNTESEIFEQAIFILRPEGKVPYKNIVKECERMMNNHIRPDRENKRKNGWKFGFFVLLIVTILLAVLCFIN
ncbi:MAG: hypothetical protein IJD09_01250 [Clostridia bacterium]|nr:hypothetical protein [Clostridia bacterium]